MVMLLRLNGIPARFSAGYRYVFPFDRQASYKVSASNAHAWPEAYIDGFGWVGFEPTSAYSTAEDRSWRRQPAGSPGESVNTVPVVTAPYPVPELAGADKSGEEKDDGADRGRFKETIKIAIVIISAVIAVALVLILGAFFIKTIRYKRADCNRRLIMDVDDIISLIRSASKVPVEDRGLVSDYEPYLPEGHGDELKEIFDIYYRIRYRCRRASLTTERVTVTEGQKARALRNTLYSEHRRRSLKHWRIWGR
jgi:hypothetical protein